MTKTSKLGILSSYGPNWIFKFWGRGRDAAHVCQQPHPLLPPTFLCMNDHWYIELWVPTPPRITCFKMTILLPSFTGELWTQCVHDTRTTVVSRCRCRVSPPGRLHCAPEACMFWALWGVFTVAEARVSNTGPSLLSTPCDCRFQVA